jgi:hypothetical protein
MINSRREALSMFLKRIFALLGAPKAEIRWPRVEDEATYRLIQAIATMWATGLFKPEELRGKFGDLVDLAISGPAPSDVLIPNTKSTLEAESAIQTKQATAIAAAQPQPTSGFAVNGQGQDNLKIGKTNDQAGQRPDRAK